MCGWSRPPIATELAAFAPESLAQRGPWRDTRVSVAAAAAGSSSVGTSSGNGCRFAGHARGGIPNDEPVRAVVALRRQRSNLARTAPALLAAASTCMEVNDLDGAARDLDEAIGAGAGVGGGAFRARQALAAARRHGARQRVVPAGGDADAGASPPPGPTWARRSASSIGRRKRWRPSRRRSVRIRRTLRRSTTSASSGASWGGSTNPRRPSAGHRARSPDWRLAITISATRCFYRGVTRRRYRRMLRGSGAIAERNPVQATRLAMCRLATGDAAGRGARAAPGDRRRCRASTGGSCWPTRRPSRGRC